MRWSDYDSEVCSVARTLDVLGDRWTILVLRELFNGIRRFSDIHEHLGISKSVLADRLRALVDQGIAERRAYQEPGDRQRWEYRLTERGRDLQIVLLAMMRFGDRHLAGDEGSPLVIRHVGCGAPVSPRLVCEDGHDVDGTRQLVSEPGPAAQRVVG